MECFPLKRGHGWGTALLSTEHLLLCWSPIPRMCVELLFCFWTHFLILTKSIKTIDEPPIISNQTQWNHLLLKPTFWQRRKSHWLPTVIATWLQKSSGLKLYFIFLQKLYLPGNIGCTIPVAHTDNSIIWAVFIGKWICKIRPTLPDYAALVTNINKVSK